MCQSTSCETTQVGLRTLTWPRQVVPRGYVSQCQGGARVRGFSRSGKPRLLLKLIPVGRSFPTRPSFLNRFMFLNLEVRKSSWHRVLGSLHHNRHSMQKLMHLRVAKFKCTLILTLCHSRFWPNNKSRMYILEAAGMLHIFSVEFGYCFKCFVDYWQSRN